ATGNFWLGFIVAPLIGFILGALTQRVVIQPIRGAAALSIVATFGLSLILQESVRIAFGPVPRRILPPITGTVPLFGIEYDIYRRPFDRSPRCILPVSAVHNDRYMDARRPVRSRHRDRDGHPGKTHLRSDLRHWICARRVRRSGRGADHHRRLSRWRRYFAGLLHGGAPVRAV